MRYTTSQLVGWLKSNSLIITRVDKDVEKVEISYNACVNEKGKAALKSSLEASAKG